MAVNAGAPRQAAAATLPPIPLRRRLYGFGSIYGKTIRDSRLAFIIAAGLLGGLALLMGAAIATVFPTPQARQDIDALFGSIPQSMMRLFGNVDIIGKNVGTLGGYITFKYGAIFVLGTAVWSIMALSGTLAGEARRGSLDFVAAAPFGKRRIGLEKLAAHLTLLWLAVAIMAVALTFSSNVFGDALLGDPIPLESSLGFALWVGSIAMLFGGLALALSPLLGRAGAAGVAGVALAATWLINGINVGGPLLALSPFSWTFNHVPLVGAYDWPSIALVLIVGVVFLAIGIELFQRRDLGVTVGLSLPTLPAVVVGTRGPTARAFGEQLPRAISWGVGMGLMGVLFASLAGVLADELPNISGFQNIIGGLFPGVDFANVGGWMQLYAELLYIVAGFAGATLVAKWASDENDGRLGEILTVPMTRARWLVTGGIAALAGVLVTTILFAAGVAIGAAIGGLEVGDALLGCFALGLFAAATVGVGFAVGGVWRTSLAAEIAALVVIVTYLIQLLAPAFNAPDWIQGLALTYHYGQPMVGNWGTGAGVVASIVIAVGGVLIGAWGVTRRDVLD
jgi:polyether ionophore transport system permease protein